MRCLVALLLLVLAGPVAAQQITVAVATSVGDAIADVARAFEASRDDGARVKLRQDASGRLLDEIADGVPTDVLVSADVETIARGVQRRLLAADTQRVFASNALVLVVPADRDSPVQRLQDLARSDVRRVATGRLSTVPAGRSAKQAIDALRLWPAVQQKIVGYDSVGDVVDAVAAGDVDAGFVYATDADRAGDRIRVVATLETSTPVRHAATVTAGSREAAVARDFVLFLTRPPAREILQRHGFAPP